MESGFTGPGGSGLDRAVALVVDALFHFELEARIICIIVAGSADLEDRAGIAFVAERENRSNSLRIFADMVAARAMAGFTADARKVAMVGNLRAFWEAARLAVGRCVALEAFGVRGFTLGFEGGDRVSVGARLPRLEFLRVAALAGQGAYMIGGGREKISTRSAFEKSGTLFVGQTRDRRMGNHWVEGVEFEAKGVGRVVTGRTNLRVILLPLVFARLCDGNEIRREVGAAAAMTGFASDVF